MKQFLVFILVISGCLAVFMAYYTALVDWVEDYKTGTYERNYGENFWKTTTLCLYSFLGTRFLKRKIPFP